MVTRRPQQYNPDGPRDFDPIKSSYPLTTRPPPSTMQEQSWPPKYPPPQRNYDENIDNFNPDDFSTNDASTMFPMPALSQIAHNNSLTYEHLRIEWSESETKWEYIARYNQMQNGVWMASAPQRKILT